MSESEENRWRKEELRGIFTLGLMAILVALRISQPEITLQIAGQDIIVTEVIDFTLVLWGAYAIAMVISLSTEIIPENMCRFSYGLGLGFLFMSFAMYYLVALVLVLFILPYYWNVVAYFLLIAPVFYVALRTTVHSIKRLAKWMRKK